MGKEKRKKERTGELRRCPSHRWLEQGLLGSPAHPNPYHTQYTHRAG